MRRLKLLVLRLARALGLFSVARRMTGNGVRILCYHGLWLADDGYPGDSMFMIPSTFAARLETLRAQGWAVIQLNQLIESMQRRGTPFPGGAVVITIDDGWYSTFSGMAPALEQYQLPATLYCDTASLLRGEPLVHMLAHNVWRRSHPSRRAPACHEAMRKSLDRSLSHEVRMANVRELSASLGVPIAPLLESRTFEYMSTEQLAELARRGIDVQLHTHNHTIHDHSIRAVRDEVVKNRVVLSEATGVSLEHFVHFCFPSGVTSPVAAESIRAIGLASGTTTKPGLAYADSNPFRLPRFVDGEQVTQVEFEAELSGFVDLCRRLLAWKKSA